MSRLIVVQILKTSLIVIVSLITNIYLCAQSSDFSLIKNQFENYRENVLQEKLYAHTDKNFYLAGELLWFKLYNVDAGLHKPLDISKVAYVEVLDKGHRPVIQTKISIEEGTGSGSFVLPVELTSGNYTFRAYTNWMKNFDADFYFEKPITVVNTIKNEPVNSATNHQINYDIRFFPEGGNLVNGIESTVGFQAMDQYGRSYDMKGMIVDHTNDTVLRFSALKFGIGSFRFFPQSGKTYKAIININGNSITREFPQAYDEGYVLHLNKPANGKISISVQTSASLNGQNIYLFAHSRQQIIESRGATITNNKAEFLIDEGKLGDGISHFTVFNNQRRPVCERLFFKRPTRHLLIDASANQQQYESRKKATININAKDEKGNPQTADMSVAVYRLDSLNNFAENIFNYLWLSSDLKGRVESAEYYFTHTDAEADQALDNLMLTHGWRRFKWEDVLKTKTYSFSFIPEFEGHIVSGVVRNKATGQPAKNIQGFLAIPGTHFQFYSGKSDTTGSVNFYTKNFFGDQEIFSQAGGRERLFQIDLKSPFSESYSSTILPPVSFSSASGKMLQASSVNMQVQNIYAADKINKIIYPPKDTVLFYIPTRTYKLDDYVRFPTMEEVLREYVQEIVVSKQNNKLMLAGGRRDASGIVYRYEPLVMIDGIPLFDDPDKIFSYDPLKVKELQVINKKYFLGTASFEGMINFRTFTGRPEGLIIDPNATVLDYEGLQLQREFYAPVYETQNQIASRLPDFRNLLYWVPKVKTDTSGKQQLSFYTSDQAGKYLVLIEGLSADGRAGSKAFFIDVVNSLFVQK